jgi:hypothetical protein
MLSTEGFFRKSTFCTLMDLNPGFGRHWVMPWIFLLNGTFIMLEMLTFLLKTFFNSMHCNALVQKCHFENCQFGNIEPLHGTFEPLRRFWFFLEVNAFIWSTMKVPFNKNIHYMYQCPSNPGFRSIKVQKEDFLKKTSVDNIFFSSLMFS